MCVHVGTAPVTSLCTFFLPSSVLKVFSLTDVELELEVVVETMFVKAVPSPFVPD